MCFKFNKKRKYKKKQLAVQALHPVHIDISSRYRSTGLPKARPRALNFVMTDVPRA